jgi:hypothetical protein
MEGGAFWPATLRDLKNRLKNISPAFQLQELEKQELEKTRA